MQSFRSAIIVVGLALSCVATTVGQVPAPFAGQNINMVSGTIWPAGDPYLQRQNEPSMAVSSRNPEHLLAGANDYRTVDIPNPQAPNILGDAWLGVYTSLDGGETWKSTLLPGYPQDTSSVGTASPLHQFTVATDPTVRAGTHGLFYYSGLVFNRATGSTSGVFVATFQDQNNSGNGDAAILMKNSNGTTHGNRFAYINAALVDNGNAGQFLDKPWIAVDIPRAGRTATCKINGQTFSSGYVYLFFTKFNGSQNNPASQIKTVVSTNCGATWSQPQILSQSQKLAQGTVAAIDPVTGTVYVAWRQIASANGSQSDAIQYAYSTNGGSSFINGPQVYTFVAHTATNQYPPRSVFDQQQAGAFRWLDVPSIAVDANGRVWVAFSQRVNGPTAGTYGSRIMLTTLPKGSSTWTTPYVADSSAPTSTAYGHQLMPSLSFAYGKLMLAWYDSRRDNLESVLACPNAPCVGLSQLARQDQPIQGSTIAAPATIFTPNLLDPTSGIRHTLDVFGGMIDPSNGPSMFSGFQISQYPYWVNPDSSQIEQGFFNPPNLPLFVQGTTPFIGDYIDIAAHSILPSGNSWVFNTQGKDATGATNAPDFHITWTDNRDVVPPPVVNNTEDWTRYDPPNSGTNQPSTYFGTGTACPTCAPMQPVCATVLDDNGQPSAYSGDRNQNIYTSRVTNGLVVRFKENAKSLSTSVPQRSFALLVKNTASPLSTTPLGSPSYYRIILGVASTSPNPIGSCTISGGTASFSATPNCYLDVAINPKTTLTQAITLNSTNASASLNVLVAQIQSIPSTGNPTFTGLQALAVINGDPTNPLVADPDFLTADNSNPDVATPYGTLPIAVGESYDPTVDGPPDASTGIFTPKIGVPAIFTPKIGTIANSSPAIATPTIFTLKIFTPKISSVQVVNPKVVNAISTPTIFTPKIFTPKIVSPDIFTPKITSLSDGSNPVTDYSWRVNNKGNTSASYSTKEFAKSAGVTCCPASCSNPNSCTQSPGCSQCQLVQHKVYESPTANRESAAGNPTCDLNVQQESIIVANITDPAFATGTVGIGSAADPTNSTLSLSPGEGNRVTLRVVAPPVSQTVNPFKTVAKGQANGASSLTITTSALPTAVVGQNYTNTMLSSLGGFGATAWSVPPDPTNPMPATLPVNPSLLVLPVTPLTLSQSGQISTSVVTAAPGTYTASVQVQDQATTSSASTPALDVQQLTLFVNQFTIAGVNPQILNQGGSTGYMKAGDAATVTVTISNQGPATATGVAPTLMVNTVSGGMPPGPTPVVNCASPVGNNTVSANGTGIFAFNCTAGSGNGYVTFTANAIGHYVNSAADVLATATAVSQPAVTPSDTSPNIIVDNVTPSLTFANASPAANAYGWNNTAVNFTYTTADNLSGVKTSLPNPLVLSSEGTNVSGSVSASDFANNNAVFTAPTPSMPPVKIDLTPPNLTAASTYTPGTWTSQNVTVTFTCADNLSGPLMTNPIIGGIPAVGSTLTYSQPNSLTSIATVTLVAETSGTTLSGACQDLAGNNAVPVQFGPIMIDKTPPVLTVMATTAPNVMYNAGTWTNQNITVTYGCVDNASPANVNSGVASFVPVQQTFSTETSSGTSTSMCTDAAGNVSTAGFSPVLIDKTPPVLTVSATTPDTNAYTPGVWTNQDVNVTYACVDNASPLNVNSGLATGSPTGSQTFTQETPFAGANASGTCSDKAGNTSTIAPLPFGPIKIDKTPPTVTGSATAGGVNYVPGTWTNQPVVVAFACTDPLSGPNNTTITGGLTISSQQTTTANGSCKDNAGNLGIGSFGPINIDTTGPAITVASPSPNQSIILNSPITPNFICTDGGGGDMVTCTPTPSGSPYTASPVGAGSFGVSATDQAGNTASSGNIPYLVVYNFTGFLSPLVPATAASATAQSDSGTFEVGTTVPVQWQLQDATNTYVSSLSTLNTVQAFSNATCLGGPTGTPIALYDSSIPSLAVGLTFDGTSTFNFNWNTSGLPTGCYNLVVTLDDTTQNATIMHLTTKIVFPTAGKYAGSLGGTAGAGNYTGGFGTGW